MYAMQYLQISTKMLPIKQYSRINKDSDTDKIVSILPSVIQSVKP